MIHACAPRVHPATMSAIVRVESAGNPFAIGVVGGRLARQPRSLAEAVATATELERRGWNFSVGVAQVNRYQLAGRRLDYAQAFDVCANLRAGAQILEECFVRARPAHRSDQAALQAALSCYYSGNFSRGFVVEPVGTSYVQRIWSAAQQHDRRAP